MWEHVDTAVHMRADGTGERILHVAARLQSDGAARQLSVIAMPYASAYQRAFIDYVRVKKPNGQVVETPVTDAMDMPSPVTSEAPLYSDLKQKQIPVRSLAAGDELEYQMRTLTTKAEVPGQFWGAEHFLNNNGVVLSQTMTLEVPASVAVQVWGPKHPAVESSKDGQHTWTWSNAQLKPTPAAGENAPEADKIRDSDEDNDGRALPSVAWTTFHSWNDVGDWYRALALPHAQPTPAIMSRANELTKDAKTPQEQVRALYTFVSEHIRYVGIDFGVGRYEPHSADDVLANQYGDCKDKDTLLEALLRAKGFAPAPALIGAGIQPVAELPSPALFNHVITTVMLSGGRVWMDATPGAEPFQVLIPAIRDEQALVIPAQGAAALEKTPADPPYPFVERFEAKATLDGNGLLKSHMTMSLHSDSEFALRVVANQVAPSQWDQVMQAMSQSMGFSGTVSDADFRQTAGEGPATVSYDYTRPSFADWDNHRILPLFPALEITWIDRDHAPDYDIDLGALRRLEAVTRIALPEGFVPEDMPAAIHEKRDYANFDQTYRMEKQELVVERTMVVLKKKVPKAGWKEYYAFTKALGAERGENYITLAVPFRALPQTGAASDAKTVAATTDSTAPSPEKQRQMSEEFRQHNETIHAMMKSAREMEIEGKWDIAQSILEAVKAQETQHERYPYVDSMLGFIAWHQGRLEEAIADYEKEVQNNPGVSSPVVAELANMYMAQKRYADAEKLAKRFVERNDVVLYVVLVEAQLGAGEKAAALATAKQATEGNPGNSSLKLEYVKALHAAGHDEEAAALVKDWMKLAAEPGLLNSVAYQLSEDKFDLAEAEELSRRSIEIEEKVLAGMSVGNADDKSYAESALLEASWDTLGWILFREGKTAEAEGYIQAAWFARKDVAVGLHLGQTLEAQHRNVQALTVDTETMLIAKAHGDARDEAALKTSIDKLQALGAKEDYSANPDMVKAPRLEGVTGSAVVVLSIAGSAVEDMRLKSGDGSVMAMAARFKGRKVADAEPAGSKARVFFEGNLNCVNYVPSCEITLSVPVVRPAQ